MKNERKNGKLKDLAVVIAALLVTYIIVQVVLYARYGINMKYKYGRNIKASIGSSCKIKLADVWVSDGIGRRKWNVTFTDKNGIEQTVELRGQQYKGEAKSHSRSDLQLSEAAELLGYAGGNIAAREIFDTYFAVNDERDEAWRDTAFGRISYCPGGNTFVEIEVCNFMTRGGISSDEVKDYFKDYVKGKKGLRIKDVDLGSVLTSEEYAVVVRIHTGESTETDEKYVSLVDGMVNDMLEKYGTITNASFLVFADNTESYGRDFMHGVETEDGSVDFYINELRESALAKQ